MTAEHLKTYRHFYLFLVFRHRDIHTESMRHVIVFNSLPEYFGSVQIVWCFGSVAIQVSKRAVLTNWSAGHFLAEITNVHYRNKSEK